jgi:hypothetical protein
MRTRRHRNKTKKDNRKRGGAALIRRATEATRRMYDKYIRCCRRPSHSPAAAAAAAAAVGVGVGPAPQPYIRSARGSRSPGASCVPCPPSTSPPRYRRSSINPQSSPPRPHSSSSSDTSDRMQTPSTSRRSAAASGAAAAAAAASGARVSSSIPSHRAFIASCIHFWQVQADNTRHTLIGLLDDFEQLDNQVQSLVVWSHLRRPIGTVMVRIKNRSSDLVRYNTHLRFWIDVSQGTVEGPLLTMMTTPEGMIRAKNYLPPQYASQLQDEVAALPSRVNRSSLAVFREL